jgi:uncharacterized protein (TIGR02453 family)
MDTYAIPGAAPALEFDGFSRDSFAWFEGLARDNTKSWFTAHRETYDREVRGALDAMLEELADDFGGRVKLFRQNRDIRFSRDKSPYKTRTYGVILDRPHSRAALYVEISAEGLFAGTGYHMLDAAQLERFRYAVLYDRSGPELERAVEAVHSKGIETFGGGALKTAPRGYPRDHPRVHLLRHKSLVAGSRLKPRARGIGRDAALDHARTTWTACEPLNAWLDEHVGAT